MKEALYLICYLSILSSDNYVVVIVDLVDCRVLDNISDSIVAITTLNGMFRHVNKNSLTNINLKSGFYDISFFLFLFLFGRITLFGCHNPKRA